MKRNIPLLLFLCIFFQLSAQSQTVNITGTVFDDGTKEEIELASIRVLNAKDSAYVTGAATNAKGKFSVAVKPGNYLVHVSFLGYLEQYFPVNTRTKTAIGNVYLKEDGILLSEATVEAKAPEIIIKGDTTEYNAAAYKVQESAVLGDLIKKIPGAEIDSEGKITVNGKDISKILVDGKEFFSEDPKTASENLPAKMVEKLQVLDQKSDMAQITGFDDGEEQTVINLVVKQGMKEGIMGTVSGGYGNKDRYEANGFVNIARGDNRLSALGNFNNNNNAGGGGGGRGWGNNRGLTETTMGGVNVAMEPSKKFKYDGDVQYRGTDNTVETTSNTSYKRSDVLEDKTSAQNSINKNMNGRFKFEWTPDSLTNIIFRPNISYSKSNQFSMGYSERTSVSRPNDNFLTDSESSSDGHTLRLDGNLLINRKLNSKGRSVTVELSGGLSDGDTDGITYSKTNYFNRDSTSIQDQVYNQKNNNYNWRARLSYLEPIGRNNFLELAYDIRNTHSETDKKTYEKDASGKYTVIAEDYTRNTKNDFLNQNISLNFQARRQKYNYTVGMELNPSRSQTSVVEPGEKENKDRARNFVNFAPRLEFNYLWDKRHNLRIRYSGQTNQASTDQLFDGVLSQSATDTTRGNPNLKPSFEHRLNIRYQKYIQEKTSTIMGFADVRYTTNAIASISRFGEGNSRNTTYENIDGNMTGRLMFMYNTPLRNKRFSINSRTSGNYNRDNTFISAHDGSDPQKNTANTYNIGENLGLKFNSDKFQFNIRGNISYEKTLNSLSSSGQDESLKNTEIYNYGGGGDFSWYLPYNFVLESDLTYFSNSGYAGGYQENSWLWNASLAKEFNIKIKRESGAINLPATLRFKIYDILQDQSNISRNDNSNTLTYSTYNTISSYFMVGLTIRFQSFKGGAKSSDMDGSDSGRRRYGPPGGGGRGPGGPMF
ncbi:TonB-dependent receptor [Dysgonomonas termitidis]|uniref:TonB-dependent receptor n=1 Tax=Dysgonomonas termitidis TaxID=1516126 RepID=A0ABV9KXN5_9BACT